MTVSFSDVFKNIELLKDSFGELKAMCGALGLDNVSSCDTINKLCFSHDGKIVYIATELAIFAVDAASHEIIAKEPVKYGAHDIKEISPGVVAVELFGSVKLFRLC